MLAESLEITLEIGYGIPFGILVIYAETTAYINHSGPLLIGKRRLYLVDAAGQTLKDLNVCYLTANVEMETFERYVFQTMRQSNGIVQHSKVDTKLID